jgi:hypothetical protein
MPGLRSPGLWVIICEICFAPRPEIFVWVFLAPAAAGRMLCMASSRGFFGPVLVWRGYLRATLLGRAFAEV